MKLGRLTKLGVERFGLFLDELKSNPSATFPKELLSSPAYFETIDDEIEIMPYKFKSRWDVANYLYSLISNSSLFDVERDIPFWVGLTAFYFDVLCPPDNEGNRKVKEWSRYIPEPANYKRYYRHLLLGPYLIYRAHSDRPERAMALLCSAPHILSEVYEQFAAYQELVTNPAIIELVTRLYYDPKTQMLKRGASDKGPGSPRRLVTVLQQFDLTWDLYAATADEILKLLPIEFEKFLKNNK
ncbi:MAG: hypothetical protein AB1509_10820 [Chloroflexota bacterium]